MQVRVGVPICLLAYRQEPSEKASCLYSSSYNFWFFFGLHFIESLITNNQSLKKLFTRIFGSLEKICSNNPSQSILLSEISSEFKLYNLMRWIRSSIPWAPIWFYFSCKVCRDCNSPKFSIFWIIFSLKFKITRFFKFSRFSILLIKFS